MLFSAMFNELPQSLRSFYDLRATGKWLAFVSLSAVGLMLFGLSALRAQTSNSDWESTEGGKMSFDVASVKRDTSNSASPPSFPLDSSDTYRPNGGLFSADTSVDDYIAFAYKLSREQEHLFASQLPKWAQSEQFRIQARATSSAATKD